MPSTPQGKKLDLPAADLASKLAIAGRAVSSSPGPYRIDGVLLESDQDGLRIVATDGRRLEIAELSNRSGQLPGQVLLPRRLVKLPPKLVAKVPAGPVV